MFYKLTFFHYDDKPLSIDSNKKEAIATINLAHLVSVSDLYEFTGNICPPKPFYKYARIVMSSGCGYVISEKQHTLLMAKLKPIDF